MRGLEHGVFYGGAEMFPPEISVYHTGLVEYLTIPDEWLGIASNIRQVRVVNYETPLKLRNQDLHIRGILKVILPNRRQPAKVGY